MPKTKEITQEKIAKYLKLEWHEVVKEEPCPCGAKCPSETVIYTCSCGETFTNTGSDQDHIADNNPDLTDPAAYLEAMAWARKESGFWNEFAYEKNGYGGYDFNEDLFDPKLGSHALAEFLEGREG